MSAITVLLTSLLLLLPSATNADALTAQNQDIKWAINYDKTGIQTVTTTTDDFSEYPEGLATPTFWLDAANTSSWTVGADGAVSIIQSKSNTRKLLSDTTGASWTGWDSLANVAPSLVRDTTLGANVVDFGAIGSRKAMIFDKETGEAEEDNVLTNIATVVMVVDTSAGGGWVFGGGLSALNEWIRADSWWGTTAWTAFNPLAASTTVSANALRHGYTRHNGDEFGSMNVGWTGGWEVFTFKATTAERAATLAATGLGINDGTASGATASGGMKIAEMIVYDTVLTAEQVTSVEKWLRQKWFKTNAYGDGGNARLGELAIVAQGQDYVGSMTTTIGSETGDTLEVNMIRGGRNKSADATMNDKLIITGDIRIGDATRYGGDITISNATVRFEPRKIPTVDELPSGLLARFDASDTDSVTTVLENGTNFVTKMANLANYKYAGKPLSLQPPTAWFGVRCRPWLQQAWGPTGLPVVDFGPYYTYNNYGPKMWFFNSDTQGDASKVKPSLTTVIAFVDTRRGLGSILNGGFTRNSYTSGSHFTYYLLNPSNYVYDDPVLSPQQGCAYIDGIRVADPCKTGCGFGAKVLALQVPGTTPSSFGGVVNNFGGALIFGEALMWDRPLTETEIRDASAYLAKRWMNKSLQGYERTEDTKVADLQTVTMPADTVNEIVVASGAEARIKKLTTKSPLTVSGGGTLKIGTISRGKNAVTVKDGSRIVYGDFSDVSAKCEAAAAPAFRFDPTHTNSWVFKEIDGENRITEVYDYPNDIRAFAKSTNQDGNFFEPVDARAPRFVTADFPAGKMPVVNFCDASGTAQYGLSFTRPLQAVRSAYVVWRPQSESAFLLGSINGFDINWTAKGSFFCYYTGYMFDWHRHTSNGYLFHNQHASAGILNGSIYTNGVVVSSPTECKMPTDEWRLVEVHTTSPVHVSALGLDRGSVQAESYGEVLLYERELTDREKIATRNYLMKKWFGMQEGDLPDLPTDVSKLRTPELDVQEDTTVDGTTDMLVDKLTGGADIYKNGEKDLEVVDCGSFSGTVHVASGTVTLSGVPTEKGALTLDGAAIRLDASQADTLISDGYEVPTWKSTLNDDLKAYTAKGTWGAKDAVVDSSPELATDEDLHLKQVIKMVGMHSCYRFLDKDNNWISITNAQTVLWVLGSKEGGGFLLGGGDHDSTHGGTLRYYPWHRGGSAGKTASDPLASDSGLDITRYYSTYRVNGESVSWNQADVLSGTWDVVSWKSSGTQFWAPTDGLAYDGRLFVDGDYLDRVGRQRLAEIIIYTNRLTDAQIASAEKYLAVKWGVHNAVGYWENDAAVELAAGATLDLDGHAQYLGGLFGAGTVVGDVTAKAFGADASGAVLTVNGTLTVAENPVVALSNVTSSDEITIATASAIAGAANVHGATFTGDCGDRKPHLRVKDNRLFVRFNQGLCLYVK